MLTEKQIKQKMAEEGIPVEAVFDVNRPKKLVWGGYEIVNSLFPDVDLDKDWYYERLQFADIGQYQNLCKKLGENEHIQVYSVREYNHGSSGGHVNFGMICDEELKTAIDLAGGLEQYMKMGG